jgi:hypothetical protein
MSARAGWVLAILSVLFLLVIQQWRPMPTGISAASYDRIRPGMSQREVEAIIGLPPGRYIEFYPPSTCLVVRPVREGHRRERWAGRPGMLEIDFDAHDSVARTEYEPYPQRDRPMLAEWFRLPRVFD